MPGGRALGALCAEKPFLTSAIMELRVPQVRRLPVCISRVDTTHKCLSLFEALGRPRPLIFAHAICATHAHSPSARSIGFCVIWVCISSSSSSSTLKPRKVIAVQSLNFDETTKTASPRGCNVYSFFFNSAFAHKNCAGRWYPFSWGLAGSSFYC